MYAGGTKIIFCKYALVNIVNAARRVCCGNVGSHLEWNYYFERREKKLPVSNGRMCLLIYCMITKVFRKENNSFTIQHNSAENLFFFRIFHGDDIPEDGHTFRCTIGSGTVEIRSSPLIEYSEIS